MMPRSAVWLRRARGLARRLGDRLADRVLQIDSADPVSWAELGLDGRGGVPYQATSWLKLLQLRSILDDLGISAADAFLEIGAGKGRVVCLAARYPFGRVLGVEISAELGEIARRNIARSLDRFACKDVRVQLGDGANFPVPDDVTVVYLNNPFGGSAWESAMLNLRASVARRPRVVVLVYLHPTMHGWLVERGFRVVRRGRDLLTYIAPVGQPLPTSQDLEESA